MNNAQILKATVVLTTKVLYDIGNWNTNGVINIPSHFSE